MTWSIAGQNFGSAGALLELPLASSLKIYLAFCTYTLLYPNFSSECSNSPSNNFLCFSTWIREITSQIRVVAGMCRMLYSITSTYIPTHIVQFYVGLMVDYFLCVPNICRYVCKYSWPWSSMSKIHFLDWTFQIFSLKWFHLRNFFHNF